MGNVNNRLLQRNPPPNRQRSNMLHNTSKTLGFKKIMVYKISPGGGGQPYLARGLIAHGPICIAAFITFSKDVCMKQV